MGAYQLWLFNSEWGLGHRSGYGQHHSWKTRTRHHSFGGSSVCITSNSFQWYPYMMYWKTVDIVWDNYIIYILIPYIYRIYNLMELCIMIYLPQTNINYIYHYDPLCICLETKPVFLMPHIYPQRIDDYRHRPDKEGLHWPWSGGF